MSDCQKTGILIVSFGTSHALTRKRTLEQIEKEITEKYPDYQIYNAYTSKIILKILKTRDQIHIFNLEEVMEQIKADGIRSLIIQPTYVLNGSENEQMKEYIQAYRNYFDQLYFSDPLLSDQEDQIRLVNGFMKHFQDLDPRKEALALMGHGTSHTANSVYAALNQTFTEQGHHNVFLGTIGHEPTIDTLLQQITEFGVKKVVLSPFLLAAGKHALSDLIGGQPHTWLSHFKNAGFEVSTRMKGIGEYKEVRDIYLSHLSKTVSRLKT